MSSVFGLGQKYCIVIKYIRPSKIIIIIIITIVVILVSTADPLSPTRVNDTRVFGMNVCVCVRAYIFKVNLQYCRAAEKTI